MKLLDILVRDLKEWPEGTVVAVQDFDGEVKFTNRTDIRTGSTGLVWMRFGGVNFVSEFMQKSEDFRSAMISREDWERARQKDGHQNEWDGVGLPPVGVVCEFMYFAAWHRGTVVAHDNGNAILRTDKGAYGFGREHSCRTLKCINQKAQSIEEMLDHYLVTDGIREFAEKLYEAGYRKQEQSK